MSAHRTPHVVAEYATQAESRGLKVIIAAAGGSAHLAGVVAAHTTLPVIGLPVPDARTGRPGLAACRPSRCRATCRWPASRSGMGGPRNAGSVRRADPGHRRRLVAREIRPVQTAIGRQDRRQERPIATADWPMPVSNRARGDNRWFSVHMPPSIIWVGDLRRLFELTRSDAAAGARGISGVPIRRRRLGRRSGSCACAAHRRLASRPPTACVWPRMALECGRRRTQRQTCLSRTRSAYLATSRPTAVNLFWALDRMRRRGRRVPADGQRPRSFARRCWTRLSRSTPRIVRCVTPSAATAPNCWPTARGVLTHCNTGGLATSEYGTALSILFTAQDQGKRLHVFVDETRPLLQGARLTSWELMQRDIPATLICDSMAAQVMKEGRVQAVSSSGPIASPPTAIRPTRSAPMALAVLAQRTRHPLLRGRAREHI